MWSMKVIWSRYISFRTKPKHIDEIHKRPEFVCKHKQYNLPTYGKDQDMHFKYERISLSLSLSLYPSLSLSLSPSIHLSKLNIETSKYLS